ncbi:flagellar basal body rod protein FlgB [Paucibacter aquatile]|jgi:flagellar basal-body rod protein FlgB|uniref:Flagellar basal body rod protein FlgB n=1 Tax=Kinneretia aquatilis TaxID=2070761 RepID=A0A2N8KRF4_9BURK|nr:MULTISPECIES: flagellar basal body rod protein FlgB [Roseateles]PND36048.1 flagellar basal body rod protein FlgB [Paucibacter aquatile]WIV99371.1 flagellar basal body rod protein FlgB [Paucibacter aquatile]
MLNRLTANLNFQTEALALRSERQRMLASNIANADTPGYQARDLDFSRALREATSSSRGSGQLLTTQGGHMGPIGGGRSEASKLYAVPAQTNLDNNTVDMDRERASFADNSVKYEATLRFINSSVRTTLDAMKSPNAA